MSKSSVPRDHVLQSPVCLYGDPFKLKLLFYISGVLQKMDTYFANIYVFAVFFNLFCKMFQMFANLSGYKPHNPSLLFIKPYLVVFIY